MLWCRGIGQYEICWLLSFDFVSQRLRAFSGVQLWWFNSFYKSCLWNVITMSLPTSNNVTGDHLFNRNNIYSKPSTKWNLETIFEVHYNVYTRCLFIFYKHLIEVFVCFTIYVRGKGGTHQTKDPKIQKGNMSSLLAASWESSV